MKHIKTAPLVRAADGQERTLSQIVVLHIPYSSLQVPPEERRGIFLDDAALNNELLRMTDSYTDELFPLTRVEAARVIFPFSRLVCDVERFPSDEDEPMATRGMGVIYTRTSMGEVLRAQSSATDRQSLLDRWYRPHHLKLECMDEQSGLKKQHFEQVRTAVGKLIVNAAESAMQYLSKFAMPRG